MKVNKEEFASKMLDLCKKHGATDAEVMIGESADLSVSCRNGKPENLERSESFGYGLRVFMGKQSATISSSKFTDTESMVETAINMAKIAPADEFAGLADVGDLARNIQNLDLMDDKEPSAHELQQMVEQAEKAALCVKGVTNSEGADASHSRFDVTLATTRGFINSHSATRSGISVTVLAGEGENMQRDYEYSTSRFFSDLEAPQEIGKLAAERAVEKLNPRKVASGKFPVVYDKRISRNLLSDLASGVNGAAVARGTSFLKNKMGEPLFAKNINIVDDPLIKKALGSRPFDGEGVACGKIKVVENGVLKSWFLDVRSANQLKTKTNGRASRGVGSNPSPSCTNFYMENGSQSLKEILSSIKSGFYVTDTFGMGINYTTGDYSQGASGFWIENGEIAFPVSEITIASNLLDMFKMMIPANDLEFKYSINAPTLLVENMTIAGV